MCVKENKSHTMPIFEELRNSSWSRRHADIWLVQFYPSGYVYDPQYLSSCITLQMGQEMIGEKISIGSVQTNIS